MDKGGSTNGASLSEDAQCGGPGGRAPSLGTLGYARKAFGTGISFLGDSVWQPGVGLSTGDFERWLKGALEVWHFSLWELCEGNLEGRLPFWGPWRIAKNALEMGISFHRAPMVKLEGAPLPRTLKDG
jgi:hypothetical protein